MEAEERSRSQVGQDQQENNQLSLTSISLPQLPREILRLIFSLLNQSDLVALNQVSTSLALVASDRSLYREIVFFKSSLETKTLYQNFKGYINLTKLTLSGVRMNKNTCKQLGKYLPVLRSLVTNLSISKNYSMDQELANVSCCLLTLSSLEIHVHNFNFTTGAVVDLLKRMQSLRRFHILQTGVMLTARGNDDSMDSRIDMDCLLKTVTSESRLIEDLKLDFQPKSVSKYITSEGLRFFFEHGDQRTPMLSFHVRNVQIDRSTFPPRHLGLQSLNHLGIRGLKELPGLVVVPYMFGFDFETYPPLKTLEVDFVDSYLLAAIPRSFGKSLRELSLCELAKSPDYELDDMFKNDCVEKFVEFMELFPVLTKLNIGVRTPCFDRKVRRLVQWFAAGKLNSLHFPVEIFKL